MTIQHASGCGDDRYAGPIPSYRSLADAAWNAACDAACFVGFTRLLVCLPLAFVLLILTAAKYSAMDAFTMRL
jgi:hypothetical protein